MKLNEKTNTQLRNNSTSALSACVCSGCLGCTNGCLTACGWGCSGGCDGCQGCHLTCSHTLTNQ